ncbi:MAG: AAA family ATPase [Actinobacteria bacterium]|nr:AAA family ATPase [Actinomycetota bacterium]
MAAVTAPGPSTGPADVFGDFCAAGLWPGLGTGLAARLAEAAITQPEHVTPARLAKIDGIGRKRAERLTASFESVLPVYRVAELLVPCRVPARFAGPAVARLGASAARQLTDDPWRLLMLPAIRPDQADWFARQRLGRDADPQDPRRGRALTGHLLARAARDGHTAVPAAVIASSLRRFRIEDPVAAIAAAVDEGTVIPLPGPADETGAGDGTSNDAAAGDHGGPGPDAGGSRRAAPDGGAGADGGAADGDEPGAGQGAGLLALARYAMAEEAVAEGLQRLLALAEPLPDGPDDESPAGEPPPDEGSADGDPAAEPPASESPAAEPPADEGTADEGTANGDAGVELDEAQQAAVRAVAGHGVSVLSGGPGTGKSRTVAAVVTLASARGLRVALAAPTGRAAKRLEELAGAPATTLHRLLGAQGRGRADDGRAPADGGASSQAGAGDQAWVFTRNEEWPLDEDLVVIDEVSMLDAELAAALVEACADGTRLLLVGDPAQLPSIGAGRVLADIIDSGTVPVTELTRLYRQRAGGVIARLATAVRGGTLPPVDSPEREVVVVPVRASTEAARRVVQLVTDSIPRALGIQPADIQVITPVHRGPAGTIELNRALKQRLNPGPGARGGFDPGDRVVSIANHADEGFTNGEVGTVTGPDDDGLLVAFPAGPVSVPGKVLGDLRHGWALTVHRAQGSEWPAVVAVFPAEATGMLSRPLVYTALTRAQRHLSVVHGAGPALARSVATIGERPRVTRLAALLRDGIGDAD